MNSKSPKNTKIINDDKKRKNETSLIKKIKNIDVMMLKILIIIKKNNKY